MNKYYVYAHYTLDTNELFYIGKGRFERAYSRKGRSQYWKRVVNKHNFRVELLVTDLSEDRAFIQEILAIKEFNPRCNFTKGGEGISGYRQSKETIEKRTKRGAQHYNFGKKRSEETKLKISLTKKLAGIKTRPKTVTCINTNKIWLSITACAKDLKINRTTLNAKLIGQSPNNTSIRYVCGVACE